MEGDHGINETTWKVASVAKIKQIYTFRSVVSRWWWYIELIYCKSMKLLLIMLKPNNNLFSFFWVDLEQKYLRHFCPVAINRVGFFIWQAMSLQGKFHKSTYIFANKMWTFFFKYNLNWPHHPVFNWPAQKLGLLEGRGGCHQVIHRLRSLTLSLTLTCNNLCVGKSVSLFSVVGFYICVFFCREVTGYT